MIRKLGAILVALALVLTLGLTPSAPVAADGQGLVALWHFDGDALDSSGNANHGDLMGDADFEPGKFDQALSLDGDGDCVEVADSATLDITDELTIEAWVRTDVDMGTNPQMQIVDKGEHQYGSGYMLMIYNGNLYGRVNKSSATAVIHQYPNDGEWHHVAYTFKSGEQKLYIDGQEVASNGGTATITENSQPLLIGKGVDRPQYCWNGLIDEVRIWNKALDAEELGRHRLTVDDNIHGRSGVSEDSWYGEGDIVDLVAPLTVIDDCTLYVFEEWKVGVESQGAGVNEITITMDGPKKATAHYKALDATEGAWAADDEGGTRFVDRGSWATYIEYDLEAGSEEDPVSYPLLAGQHHDAGVVLVWNDAKDLYVRYMPKVGYEYVEGIYGEWLIEWTHLHVADDLEGFNDVRTYHRPSGEYRNPIPGQFDFSNAEGDYAIQLDDDWTETIVIAAHADVKWCPIAYAPTPDNMALWLDASALTLLDDSSVVEWADLSGEGNDATGHGDPMYKKSILNDRPVVRFDGINDYFAFPQPSIADNDDFTIFVVATVRGVSDDDERASFVYAGNIRGQLLGVREFATIYRQHGYYRDAADSNPRTIYGPNTDVTDVSSLFVATYDTGSVVMHLDGMPGPTYSDVDYAVGATWHIGSQAGRRFLDGDIAEILIYHRALDDDERELVEEYLMAKYNL